MFDSGSTGFMILGAMLVFLMTPALAFFYGGLSRRKNVLNTMFMSIAVIGFVGVLWIVAGWLVVCLRWRRQLSVLRRFRPDFLRGAAR